jgi:hypothetical protein
MVMIDNAGSILFLWAYMITIWIVVVITWKNKPEKIPPQWKYLFGSFFLLAFGDIFHLLPRTYIWYQYSIQNQLDAYVTDLGIQIYGIGLIFTGITMTFFYLGFYLFWKSTFIEKKDIPELSKIKENIKIFDIIAISSCIIRTILIFLPWNNWGTSPIYHYQIFSFRLITNLPLYVIGIEVLYLFMKSLKIKTDISQIPEKVMIAIKGSTIWIIVSYVTYTITILGVNVEPMLGMMMIPKTIAYLIVLYYMYKNILNEKMVLNQLENLNL